MSSAASTAALLYSVASPVSTRLRLRRRPLSVSASTAAAPEAPTSPKLPVRKIPGDYGPPLIGPIRDRYSYFYGNGGREEFFRSRARQYDSTVFRANMPPGPFIASDPRVIVLLDAASFPVLFDTSLVEKRDLFTGTFAPSLDLTGGYRILSYIDPSEPKHAPLKRLLFFVLSNRRDSVIPEFRRTFGLLFDDLESELSKKGKADFGSGSDLASFDFLARALFDRDPASSPLGRDAPSIISKWVLFQIGPLLSLGLPSLIEELLLHSFPLPPFLIKKDYERLASFFRDVGGAVFEEAERLGIPKEEAVHNIVFAMCFNSFGGMKILFPGLVKWLGKAGAVTHGKLAEEVRKAVKEEGKGEVTMKAVEAMPLVKSAVWEALRMEPPVPLQYGKAKRDMVVESHDAGFEVKAGEMLFGYQPFATKDPKVFERAEEYVVDRFVGAEGEKLLEYVVWSNGPETETPTVSNKQCAGKDFVVLMARLLVVEIFLRYDTFDVEIGTSPLGSSVKLTSLKRATF